MVQYSPKHTTGKMKEEWRMRFPIPFLCLTMVTLAGCGEAMQGEYADFCGHALARVDSFMVSSSEETGRDDGYGGTAVVGTIGEIDGGMNGFGAAQAATSQHQMFVNLMTLIQYDADLQPVPYLADSWEVSEDETEVTFHLRDDVYWHDGELTTAYDVEFTFLRATDPASGFPNPSFFQYALPGTAGVQVVDSFTVRFIYERPHADFLDPWRTVAIMPRHLLEEVPSADLPRHPFGTVCPVGNGPFRFVSHDPGSQWIFEANPAFPEGLGGRPFLDRYVYRIIPEASTLLAELLTGGVDVYVSLLPNFADRVSEDPSLELVTFPYRVVFFAGWNQRVEKLSDPRVRRALTIGTNRSQILEGLRGGQGAVVNTGVPVTHWAFDPSLGDSLPYNPDRARALLSEAGWEDRDGDGIREDVEGTPLTVQLLFNTNQERQEVAEIMQAQLREVGVDLRPMELEISAFFGRIFPPERDFEGFLLSWEAEFRLDERDLFHSASVDGSYGFSGTQDAALDRYLDTLQLVTDRTEASRLWREYQLRLMAVQPFTFLYSPYRQSGVNKRLRGVEMDVRGDWQNLREWRIEPEDRRVP
jgi:peptide/nickel transport system substrate-binding protein